jgi:hypothetical protein
MARWWPGEGTAGVPISDRDREILWAKAGNRCSKCKQVLVQPGEAEGSTDHAVVGEECHVISPKHDGPRGRFEALGDLDAYANLILLCPSDHTLIDQLPDEWPPSRLHAMKTEHEAWVNERLSPKPKPKFGVHREPPAALVELVTASDLVRVAMGVEESSMDHEDLADDEDVEVVAGFLQNVFDYSEMWSDYEPGERIRAEHELGRALAELREQGWRLFGARGKGSLRGQDGSATPWSTAYLRVVRADSDEIVKVDPVAPTKAPPPPDDALAIRAGMAGVTMETQAQREMKDTLPRPAVQAEPPPLPRRLRGLSGGELGTYGWRMLIARRELLEEGRSHQSQLNRSGSLVASDEPGWRQRIGQWEAKVVAWSNEWGWAPDDEVRQALDDGEAAVDPSNRPLPEWRARVSGRIDGGLGWIDAHWATIEQLGLHTE